MKRQGRLCQTRMRFIFLAAGLIGSVDSFVSRALYVGRPPKGAAPRRAGVRRSRMRMNLLDALTGELGRETANLVGNVVRERRACAHPFCDEQELAPHIRPPTEAAFSCGFEQRLTYMRQPPPPPGQSCCWCREAGSGGCQGGRTRRG